MFLVECPYCGQQISLSEQSLGQSVSCPKCTAPFHVSAHVRSLRAPHTDSSQLPEPPPLLVSQKPVAEVRRKLFGPAVGLIVTGAGTTLLGLFFIPALLFPEFIGQQVPPEPLDVALSTVLMVITLVLGIGTLFGSIKMLRLENYRLAVAAAIAAMFPCYCCFLGLPIGIWALVVLRDPDVKRAFDQFGRESVAA